MSMLRKMKVDRGKPLDKTREVILEGVRFAQETPHTDRSGSDLVALVRLVPPDHPQR